MGTQTTLICSKSYSMANDKIQMAVASKVPFTYPTSTQITLLFKNYTEEDTKSECFPLRIRKLLTIGPKEHTMTGWLRWQVTVLSLNVSLISPMVLLLVSGLHIFVLEETSNLK